MLLILLSVRSTRGLFNSSPEGAATSFPEHKPNPDCHYALVRPYAQLYRVRQGEIVISNIAASYGSTAVVPSELDGLVVSKEYTVLKPVSGFDARITRALLRSPEIKAEMLLRATGANRTRIRWTDIQDIAVPYPDDETASDFLGHIESAEAARVRAISEEAAAADALNDTMLPNGKHARMILDAFKPPK